MTNANETNDVKRGHYDQIVSIGGVPASAILARFKACLPEGHCDFDKHSRGSALNVDLYGYDAEQNVAVVQVREFSRAYKRGYPDIRKTYAVVGFGEHGEAFRHPVSAAAVRAAIRKDSGAASAVHGAQRWMWGCTEKQRVSGVRQGDLLMVRERGVPAPEHMIEGRIATVAGSHVVRAYGLAMVDGVLWALSPSLYHAKNQHAPAYVAEEGWYSVRVGQEAAAWSFAERVRT